MKSKSTQKEVAALRKRMFALFDLVPETGCYVDYQGMKFKVYPTVFWPHEDSMALVNNYKIKQGESVLDVCTGSGNIAIVSALRGAGSVVALEHNPLAVEAAKENVRNYNLDNHVEIRQSDMFSALRKDEKFDVITGNLPFTNNPAKRMLYTSMHDTNLRAHKLFFEGAHNHLNPGGRIYLAHMDLGAMDDMFDMARRSGFQSQLIGEYEMKKPHIVFSAFELRRGI